MFYQYVCSLGIEPTTFALLTLCSTTEPQEHLTLDCLGMGTIVAALKQAGTHDVSSVIL